MFGVSVEMHSTEISHLRMDATLRPVTYPESTLRPAHMLTSVYRRRRAAASESERRRAEHEM